MKCAYLLIRFVPDSARGEFLNVGVIARCAESECTVVRIAFSKKRARTIASTEIVDGFSKYLDDFRSYAEHGSTEETISGTMDLEFSDFRHSFRSVFQLSDAMPIVANDAEEAADLMARELLFDYQEPEQQTRRLTKHQTIRKARASYRQMGLIRDKDYFERPTVSSSHYEQTFDFAVKNGRIVQLAQAWNFAQRDTQHLMEQVKSWAFTIEELRQTGGKAIVGESIAQISSDVDIEAVCLMPRTAEGKEALEEAQYAFEQIHASLVPEGQIERLGKRAAELLQ